MGNHADLLSDASSATPTRRVVLLGASNLTRGISTVLETAWQFCGRPLDVMVAHGHGRSYGMTSSLLTRRLPGILNSGLWPALSDRPPLPTVALITDIGNDLLYGAPVPKVLEWVTECITRLEAAGARGSL